MRAFSFCLQRTILDCHNVAHEEVVLDVSKIATAEKTKFSKLAVMLSRHHEEKKKAKRILLAINLKTSFHST